MINTQKEMVSVMRTVLHDQFTSPQALGVLLYIWSSKLKASLYHHPWQLYESNVIKHFRGICGKYSIHSAFKELENRGYLERHINTNNRGRFTHKSIWIVHNKPLEMRKVTKLPY